MHSDFCSVNKRLVHGRPAHLAAGGRAGCARPLTQDETAALLVRRQTGVSIYSRARAVCLTLEHGHAGEQRVVSRLRWRLAVRRERSSVSPPALLQHERPRLAAADPGCHVPGDRQGRSSYGHRRHHPCRPLSAPRLPAAAPSTGLVTCPPCSVEPIVISPSCDGDLAVCPTGCTRRSLETHCYDVVYALQLGEECRLLAGARGK
jgi:hypothetical protein